MPRGVSLSEKARLEWSELLRLADKHYERNVAPTKIFVDMYRNNSAHWTPKDLSARSWAYDRATANLVYSSVKNTLPRVLLQHPKVLVRPMPQATGRIGRLGQQPPEVRWHAALGVQQFLNWRVREFDFKRQSEKVQLDDHLRGMGAIRHGFAAPEDVSYTTRGGRKVEFSHHEHIRPGWPFAIYWPLDEMRLDPLARSDQELQWVGFRDLWRMDDLKKFPNVKVPSGLEPTVIAGLEANEMLNTHHDNTHAHEVLGRVPIMEIWDRRTHRVIWWSPRLNQEIGMADWPIEWEGVPLTLLAGSPINTEIAPVAEQDILHELQQTLNKLLSLVLVYAKRGVSLIGVNKNALLEGEEEKIADAEILETVLTKTNPNDALARWDLAPIPQTLLISITRVQEFIREISGQGRIASGTRENVESGTEAAGIIEALELRNQDRRNRLEDFMARVVRKDYQTFQQTVTEDQILDVMDEMRAPRELSLSVEEIKFEFDIAIEVGSTAPDSDIKRKNEALQLAALLQSPLAPFFNPAFIARHVATAFGLDMAEALNDQEGVVLEQSINAFNELLPIFLGGQSKSASSGNGSLPAALDASKVQAQPTPTPGGTPRG